MQPVHRQLKIGHIVVILITLLLINFNFSKVCWQSRIWSILIWSIFIWSIIATHRTSSLTIPKFKNLFSETPSIFTKSYHGSIQSFYQNVVKTLKIIILIFFSKNISYDSYEEKFIEAPGMKKKSFGSFQSFFQNFGKTLKWVIWRRKSTG